MNDLRYKIARWMYERDSREFVRAGWDNESDEYLSRYLKAADAFMYDVGVLAKIDMAFSFWRACAAEAEYLLGPTAPGAAAMFDPDYMAMGIEETGAHSRFMPFTTAELEELDELLSGVESNAKRERMLEEITRVLDER